MQWTSMQQAIIETKHQGKEHILSIFFHSQEFTAPDFGHDAL